MRVETEIQRFKMQLLRKMPFYGDVLMQLSFVEDSGILTAATDGKTIWYNPRFLDSLSEGARNFVLMHEVFHVLLRHGIRNVDGKKDKDIWNVACDIIVNDMLLRLKRQMENVNIPFEKPSVGIFADVTYDETVENLYEKIKADSKKNKNGRTMTIRKVYTENPSRLVVQEIRIPTDIKDPEMSIEEALLNDRLLKERLREVVKKHRGTMESYYVPTEVCKLGEDKLLDWRRLLKDLLSEEIGEDSSYATPERKYLHMDIILPGHSLTEEHLEEVWAFVDSSGSIGTAEMQKFLTQIYQIAREFKCMFNVCYWDTSVTDVYKKIRREEDIKKCVPQHSGGTDINCVYDWIKENQVKPDVMLIMTDGYFGQLSTPSFQPKFGKRTILVLSTDINISDSMKKIGKIARLKETKG